VEAMNSVARLVAAAIRRGVRPMCFSDDHGATSLPHRRSK
jgi:hypothetical protein